MKIEILNDCFKDGWFVGSLRVTNHKGSLIIHFGMPLAKGHKEWVLANCPFNGPLRGEILSFLDEHYPRVRRSFLRSFNGHTYKELRDFISQLYKANVVDQGQARRLQALITEFERNYLPLDQALEMLIQSYEG